MAFDLKRIRALVLRLIVGLLLLHCPRQSAGQGTWTLVSLPPKPGDVADVTAMAVDAGGSLYIADVDPHGLALGSYGIEKRDAQGNWSDVAASGAGPGQVSSPTALAVDAAGNLYVADFYHDSDNNARSRIQKRDPRGNWSIVANQGASALAADAAGNLFVAWNGQIQKRDARGNWSILAPQDAAALAVDAAGNLYAGVPGGIWKRDARGSWSGVAASGAGPGQVIKPRALAVDRAGNLYVAEFYSDSNGNDGHSRLQKRDAQGNWSVLATLGTALGQVSYRAALAADGAGNLYVADSSHPLYVSPSRIQIRDAQGNWSVLTTRYGDAAGQTVAPTALAVDAAGNLYVAEDYSYSLPDRLQKRDAQGNWSVIAALGEDRRLVRFRAALAADAAGNLYVADWNNAALRIQMRDAQGNWCVIATRGGALDQVSNLTALAVDTTGSLYVAESSYSFDGEVGQNRIHKRDAQGNWSEIGNGQVFRPSALAVDRRGNLYVADQGHGIQERDAQGNWTVIADFGATALAVDTAGNLYVASGDIQKRDAQGNWTVIATEGTAPGQINEAAGLAVDGAGNLYVADTDNNRVLKYTPGP